MTRTTGNKVSRERTDNDVSLLTTLAAQSAPNGVELSPDNVSRQLLPFRHHGEQLCRAFRPPARQLATEPQHFSTSEGFLLFLWAASIPRTAQRFGDTIHSTMPTLKDGTAQPTHMSRNQPRKLLKLCFRQGERLNELPRPPVTIPQRKPRRAEGLRLILVENASQPIPRGDVRWIPGAKPLQIGKRDNLASFRHQLIRRHVEHPKHGSDAAPVKLSTKPEGRNLIGVEQCRVPILRQDQFDGRRCENCRQPRLPIHRQFSQRHRHTRRHSERRAGSRPTQSAPLLGSQHAA